MSESPDERSPELLPPWVPVSPEDAAGLEAELARELTRPHALVGKRCAVIARRLDADDVLVRIRDPLAYAIVHLTWSQPRDPTPHFPGAVIYASLTELEAALYEDDDDA